MTLVDGKVGIGTTSPSHKLSVVAGSSAIALNEYNNGAIIWLDGSNGDFSGGDYFNLYVPNETRVSLGYVGGEALTVTSGSNVGIGTTSPSAKLHVVGDAIITGKVTAQEFHTEFVSASIIYQSGSTKFGDTSDDVHSFSGSLRVTGSGDHYFTDGNVGIGTTSPSNPLDVEGKIGVQRVSVPGTIATRELTGAGHTLTAPSGYHSLIVVNGTTEQMRVNSSGNVGIGTTSPASILNTSGSNQGITHDDSTTGKGYIRFRNGGTQLALFGVAGSWEGSTLQDTMIAAETGHNIRFYTNGTGTPKMYISGSGNVGIGTTSPDDKLHVVGNLFIENLSPEITLETGASHYNWQIAAQENVDAGLEFSVGSQDADASNDTFSPLMTIKNTGNVGIGNTSPANKLEVNDTQTTIPQFQIRETSSAYHRFGILKSGSFVHFVEPGNDGLSAAEYLMTINMNGNNVGIGTTSPYSKLEAYQSAAGAPLRLRSESGNSGNVGMMFSVADDTVTTDAYQKGAIYFQGDGTGNAVGDLVFAVNNTLSSTNVSISDEKLRIKRTGEITMNGDLTVGGKVTAQEFHTEFVSASIIYQSGSTKFGDTSDDVHSFSGSLRVTGSGDHYFTDGNVGIGTTSPGATLHLSDASNSGVTTFSANGRIKMRGDGVLSWGASANQGSLTWDTGYAIVKALSGQQLHLGGGNADSNIVIDTSGNVGIGTTSPSAKLHVSGTVANNREFQVGNDYLVVTGSNGNVGIGTTSPSAKLDVAGAVQIGEASATPNIAYGLFGYFGIGLGIYSAASGGTQGIGFWLNNGSAYEAGRWLSNGNLGIGTTSPKEKLHVQGNITGSGNLTLEGNAGYSTFESGFGGSGWRIDNSANAEFQNLTVRGTFSVYELLAQQIRATNGSLLVATSGKVDTSTGGSTGTLTFDTGNVYGHGFLANDIILAQRLDTGGTSLKRSFLRVDSRVDSGSLTYTVLNGDNPEAGQEFVRIGNTSNADRQGHIYLTADDSNAPYIGVRDGVSGSTQFTSGTGSIEKVRMGKLSGITSNTFGTLSGYGLWASGSVYLEGGISATFGDIGGFNITDSAITSSGNLLSLKSNGQITASNALIGGTSKIAGFTVSDTQINSGTNLVLKSSGQITGSNVLFTGGKISGSSLAIDVTTLTAKGNTVEISGSNFHLLNGNITASNVNLSGNISATTGNIGGFSISSDALSSGTNFYLSGSATGTGFFISASNFNVKANGQLTASAAQITGNVTATSGNIGGFSLSQHAIAGSGFYLSGSATGTQFFISASNFNVKANGQLTASAAQITGNVTATSGNIGGFSLSQHAIAGSGFYLSGSATGTGFFISASNFNVKANGQLTASAAQITGNVTATSGNIGGFSLSQHAIAGSGFYLSGSATGTQFFISASNFNVKANGQLTASAAFIGGTSKIAGFDITDTQINDTGNNLLLKSNGQITASAAQITGDITATNITATTAGNIAGWTIGSNTLSSGDVYLSNVTNEKGLYIGDGLGEPYNFQVGEFPDITPTSTPMSLGTAVPTDTGTKLFVNAVSPPSFGFDAAGSSADSGNIKTPLNTSVAVGDTVNVSQPVSFQSLTSDGSISSITSLATVTLELLSGSSEVVVASDSIQRSSIYSQSKTLSVSYTTSASLASGALKVKVSYSSQYNRASDPGNLTEVNVSGLSATKDEVVTNITNQQILFYQGPNKKFELSPAGLEFKGGQVTLDSIETEGITLLDSGSINLDAGSISIKNGGIDIGGANSHVFISENDFVDPEGYKLFMNSSSPEMILMNRANVGTISMIVDGGSGQPEFAIRRTTSNTEVFRIDNNGNVGIGTTSPSAKLHVSGTVANNREFQVGNDYLVVTGSNGNVGIGTTSPSTPLHVIGNIYSTTRVQGGNTTIGSATISSTNFASIGSNSSGVGIAISRDGNPSTYPDFIINSSGNVGIGTTSPGNRLHVSGSNNTTPVRFEIGANANYYFQANSTSGYATTFNMDNTGLDIGHNSSGRSLNLKTNNTDRLTILGGGNVGIGTISPPEKLTVQGNISASGNIILASGQGIDFSATGQAAGMSSELLDDYEEGTWTPQWVSGDFDTVTMDVVNATYTKVGNLVTLCAYVRTDLVSLNGSPSAAYMTGVPFQPISNDYFAVNVGYSAGWPGDEPTGGYLLHTSGTGTRINFHYRTSANGTSTTLSSTDFGDPSGDDENQLIFTITYHT
jgi:hypothetical protein